MSDDVRLRRGVYSRPDRIVISLTAGSLNNNYIAVGDHLGFSRRMRSVQRMPRSGRVPC